MNDPSWTQGPPKVILLATDLSSRCDRAMDRAAHLANVWGAHLVVLNVLEDERDFLDRRLETALPSWRRPPDAEAVVALQLRRDLREEIKSSDIRVVEGEAVASIDAVAREVGADLIVTGVARDETLGRFFLGSTVERLARQTALPLLIVKSRFRPYGEVLITTDFSSPSQHALTAAARFFPASPLTLLHAWDLPFSNFLDRPEFKRQWTAMEKEACDRFVAGSGLTGDQYRRLTVLLEHGRPETIVRTYMRDKHVDLVVVGTHGRSGIFDVRLGGTARQILEAAPGDVLLIREPRSLRKRESAGSGTKTSATSD